MSEDCPLISVVVPVYKVEPYLQKCVDSLLVQTYTNIEIILVDDGSPDNCPAMCDQIAIENEKVVAYHKQNGGLGSARNYGVEKAKGNWIAFVDSDDYVLPEYIMYMWNLQQKFEADFVTCGITAVDEGGHVLSNSKPFSPYLLSGKEAISAVYFQKQAVHRSNSKLIKKGQLVSHPFPDGYFEDFATTYLFFHECQKVVIGDGATNYRYVQRNGSILHSKLNKKHLHAFEICDEIRNFIEKNYPEYCKYIPLLYQGQVIQILNRQSMDKKDFKKIFICYQSMFRKNFMPLITDPILNRNTKLYLFLLCGNPMLYKMARNVVAK